MEAKEVINKILTEAQNEADEIKKKAKAEVDQYQQQTERQLADFDEQTDQLAKKAAEDKSRRVLASARMKSRKDILSAKQKVLGEVFKAAREKILSMDKQAYCELFTKLIYSAVEKGDEVVIPGAKEDVIDSSVIDRINQDENMPKASSLSLSEQKGEFDRGVLLTRGDVRVNISLNVMLETARDNLETEIANELFNQ